MKRIIIHWTAGTYTPNEHEKNCYHYLIAFNPKNNAAYQVNGRFKPEDNLNCYDGKYAAHTGGGNTGSIGVSLCAMGGYKNITEVGNYPIRQEQLNLLYKLCSQLSKKYSIPINSNCILTHYKFGLKNPNTTSKGKIDIVYLPSQPNIICSNVGDYIRNNIKKYV